MSATVRRRVLGLVGAAPLVAGLKACLSPGAMPAHVYYELEDSAPTRAAATGAARGARTLLVAGVAASAFVDGTGLAYSRAPGARAYYHFASWSERPAVRIARLLQRRLAAGGTFADVASADAPVRGDWLLELQLEQLFHDDVSPPGVARIGLTAELTDRAARRTIGRRRFEQDEPLASESAEQAVAAFNRALVRVLADAEAWVLAQARAARPPA